MQTYLSFYCLCCFICNFIYRYTLHTFVLLQLCLLLCALAAVSLAAPQYCRQLQSCVELPTLVVVVVVLELCCDTYVIGVTCCCCDMLLLSVVLWCVVLWLPDQLGLLYCSLERAAILHDKQQTKSNRGRYAKQQSPAARCFFVRVLFCFLYLSPLLLAVPRNTPCYEGSNLLCFSR